MNFAKFLLIALTVCVVVPAVGTMTALGDTIAYWRFEETTLPTAFDETANDLDLVTGTATSSTAVPVNPVPQTGATNVRSASFNGSTEYLTRPDNDLLDFAESDEFTIEGWIRPEPGSGRGFIVDKRSAAIGYEIEVRTDGNLGFWGKFVDGGSFWATGSTYFVPDVGEDPVWVHFAAVYEGSKSAKIYINGQLDGQDSGTAGSSTLANAGVFHVGEDNSGGSHFTGLIDELRISGEALAPSEFLCVPEPSTLALLTCGLIGLLCYAWRRKRA